MILNDFMTVCDSFTLHLDFVCDFEEHEIDCTNRVDTLKQWDGLEIKRISIDFDKNGKEVLLVESVPIQCEDE